MNDDLFADISKLALTPEQIARANAAYDAKAKQRAEGRKRERRERVAGEFYLVSAGWFDRAVAAVSSKEQLAAALRIYRRWLIRPSSADTLTVSNAAVAGPGFTRHAKRKVVQKLAAAGLLQVVEHRHGRAPRVRIVEG